MWIKSLTDKDAVQKIKELLGINPNKNDFLSKIEAERIQDAKDRVKATREAAIGTIWVIFWPSGVLGFLVGGIRGLIAGMVIGVLFYIWILLELRYGREY